MNRRTALLAAALTLTTGLALTACGSSDSAPKLQVDDAYMPQPISSMAAGFMTVKNTGDTADKLTSVTSDLSDDVTIHETVGNKMQEVKSLDIPANGELKLASGGNHLMFMGLKKKPAEGDKVTVELHFATSKPVKVEIPVKASTFDPKKK
ncbi:copper chaperone PCu(A)C [Streptomyces sp. NPDC003077]|uniref:copper chaperone PCu(A)C n=1 Tax=Streptomyces sp. NPDC003077 TaxID=3154443 RepID=UPI0033BAAF7E